ncbi:MAG: hypothetical protein LUQ67_00315 [Methanomicrobiales archaeon]|nr:hypothetical protein [Methanomicrobiales archaeon]
MTSPPDPSSFGEYMKRVSHVIALQGIFAAILLLTLYLPDRSVPLLVRGQETLTLLDVNSLAVFALFLVLTIAIFRQESEGTLRREDPFLRVLEGYGSPSGSTTLFRAVHAIFSVVMILVYLMPAPVSTAAPTLHQEAGILVLFLIVVLSSRAVSSALSRFADRTMAGFSHAFACLVYLLGLGLIFGGAISGIQNLLIAGKAVISLEILYVVVREDRRVRAAEAARDG